MDDGGPNSGILLIVLIVLVGLDIVLRVCGKVRAVLKARKEAQAAAEENILSMVNESHEQGYIEASEAEMISNIFEFGDKQAQDIMTDRSNITAIEAEMTLNDAMNFMLNESNSRFPVYKENLDHIIGIIYLKDAFRIARNRSLLDIPIGEVEGLLRTAHFIPETRNVDDLFKTMRATKLQMVMVIDEYGQTSGLVALEDILEEIVGNIQDEYDDEKAEIVRIDEDVYTISGDARPEDAEEQLGFVMPEDHNYDTMSAFIVDLLGRIPEQDEDPSVIYDNIEFTVLLTEDNWISKIKAKKLEITNEETEA